MKDVIIDYLRAINLKIADGYVEKQLLSHPDYPSILSVSDVMEQLGLIVQVGKIEKKQLPNIPFPYLLYSITHKDGLLLINNEQTLVKYLDNLESGKGIILKAVNESGISDPYNEEYYRKEYINTGLKYTALIGTGLLLLFSLLPALSSVLAIFLITVFSGLFLGYVLIAKDVGVKYTVVESFCSAGTTNKCDEVLTSKYSKLFGTFTFSDLVLTYFVVQTVLTGFVIPNSAIPMMWWSVLSGMAALSIPAIVYSVYYQWAKIQAWCSLCLLVIGVLALQIGFFSYILQSVLYEPIKPGISELGTTVLLFMSTGSAIVWVKELVKSKEQTRLDEAFSNRVKYDPKVFAQYLLEERKVDITQHEKEVSIGNPEAPLRLIMVSNLFCNPCKAMHENLNKLLRVWPQKLHISFRFLAVKNENKGDTDPREILLNYWLTHIQGKDSAFNKTQQIIKDWFRNKNKNSFREKYSVDSGENPDLHELTSFLDIWVKKTKITKTPTLFLNGFEFPQKYKIEDLVSMIPGLIDHFQQQNEITIDINEGDVKDIV